MSALYVLLMRRSYLEVRDKQSVEYRPWLWIAWLLVGPTISSISFDWYIFVAVSLPFLLLNYRG